MDQLNLNLQQGVLYKIISHTVTNSSIEEMLGNCLDEILSIPWLTLQNKGGFFLKNEDKDSLRLVAYKNVSDSLVSLCSQVNYGQCLCGLAAERKELIFRGCVDGDHHNHPTGMTPHGHYNAPLIWQDKVLGVLFLYLNHGHQSNDAEQAFITSVAQVIAQAIYRKQTELKLKEAFLEVQTQEEEIRQQNEELRAINEALENATDKIKNNYTQERLLREQAETAKKDLEKAQGQLVHSEKMASLGQMTAGIAHEINNPVNFISGGVQGLRLLINEASGILDQYREVNQLVDTADNEHVLAKIREIKEIRAGIDFEELRQDVLNLLEDIELGTERVTEIIRSLRNFARLDDEKSRTASLHELINSNLIILRNKTKDSQINIVTDYDDEVTTIECFPGKLNQVVLNIISNAIDSFDTKQGQIKIQTKNLGAQVQLRISDNGKGMDSVTQSKIFDPFFTTKDIGKGTGIGLAIVHGIMQTHQGMINVESALGEGTSFILTLYKVLPVL